jgi:Cu/Ag efflux pump CusA
MISRIVGIGVKFARLVLAATLGVLGVGLYQLHDAAVDVYPEFDPPAVQIQAEALGLSAQEVEQLITVPLEQDLLNGIPWVEHISSRSMPGLSAIDLHFEPGTDLAAARQLTQERMTQAKALPNVGTPPIMVQATSSTSRIAMVAMHSDTVSTMQMSVLARWQIRPRLMSIPGVANVSIWGLRDRQLQVQVDPVRLRSSKVTLTELIESAGNALWVSPLSFVEASTPGTGGFVETPNQRLGVQHVQPISSSDQLSNVALEGERATPLRIGDVATVTEDHQPLIGDASLDGAPGLMMVVERFPGANTLEVTRQVDEALDAMAPGLSGIQVDAHVFRPASYLTSALSHLGLAGLIAGALFVVAVSTLAFSWRVALISLVAVPLSLVSALGVLHLRGETLTTMTLLGLAAAAALVVDDVLGDVAEIRRSQLAAGPDGPRLSSAIGDLVAARRGPLLVASVMSVLVLGPVLSMGGLVARFAWPAAATYALAVAASLVVALLVTPALAVLLLRDGRATLREGLLDRRIRAGVDRATPLLSRPGLVGSAAAALALGAILVAVVGPAGSVLPTLHDRNVLVRVQGAPGTSLPEMNRVVVAMAKELRATPGVQSAGAHVGRAINADEIVDVNAGEIWLTVAADADYSQTLSGLREVAAGYPGLRTSVGTYAADQVDASRPGVGDALVVRVSGPEFDKLQRSAADVSAVLSTIPGVLSPRVQPTVSEPTVEIRVKLAAAERNGLRPGDVRREASTLISGLTVGSLYEQQKVFDVVVRGGPATRQSLADLQSLVIDTPAGGHVRLGDVAEVSIASNPVAITHQSVSRSLDVTAQVEGRGAADVAQEVTSRLRALSLPYEYRAEVLGDAAEHATAQLRLAVSSAVVALLCFLVLQAATGSWRLAGALTVSVPLAMAGPVLISPLVGGLRTLGVVAALVVVLTLALRQTLVFVRRARALQDETGATPAAAVSQALHETAPAVVGTALVSAAALVAFAVLGRTAGLEVLQPFAVSMLAGLVTAASVTLVVVPTLYLSAARSSVRPAPAGPPSPTSVEVSP